MARTEYEANEAMAAQADKQKLLPLPPRVREIHYLVEYDMVQKLSTPIYCF